MSNWHHINTSAEVWAVLHARHRKELTVFATFSDPDGEYTGRSQGCMETTYGFKGCEYPLMEARTTWTIDPEQPHKRIDEQHQYWLCLPIKEIDA